MIWGLIAAILTIFWPLWDARETIGRIVRYGDDSNAQLPVHIASP